MISLAGSATEAYLRLLPNARSLSADDVVDGRSLDLGSPYVRRASSTSERLLTACCAIVVVIKLVVLVSRDGRSITAIVITSTHKVEKDIEGINGD